MNDQQSFEREVATWIAGEGATSTPDQTLDDILTATGRKRPLPRWLALIKEPPMRISSNVAVGSPMVRVVAIMVATLLITLIIAGAGIAGSRLLAADGTIVVAQDGSGDAETITEAVAMAEDGDTILVRPGTYDESLVITKDITVRGDGDRDTIVVELSTVMPASATGETPDLPTAFLFEASDATLENLTIRGDSSRIVISAGGPLLQDLFLDGIGMVYLVDPGVTVPSGLEIQDGSTATIQDSLLTFVSIDIETGSSPTIRGNDFTGGQIWMQGAGVDPVIEENVLDGSAGLGIAIWGGAQPLVRANTVLEAATGIDIRDTGFGISDVGTAAVVRDNKISGARTAGISVARGAAATIDGNDLTGNETGVDLDGSDAVVTGNVVRGGRLGMNVNGRGSPVLKGNTIEGQEIGLMLRGVATPTLSGNTICDNGKNLVLSRRAEMPDTEGNDICEDAPAENSE